MRISPKGRKLRVHLERFIDRARWPDYVLTDADLAAYILHESTGRGEKPAPLAWRKRAEEITINQLWSEMAEWWSGGNGWYYQLMHTIRCEMRERNGSNIWMRRLLTIAKSIRKRGFMGCMIAYTGFSGEELNRYLKPRSAP